jgi:hypothetical protein
VRVVRECCARERATGGRKLRSRRDPLSSQSPLRMSSRARWLPVLGAAVSAPSFPFGFSSLPELPTGSTGHARKTNTSLSRGQGHQREKGEKGAHGWGHACTATCPGPHSQVRLQGSSSSRSAKLNAQVDLKTKTRLTHDGLRLTTRNLVSRHSSIIKTFWNQTSGCGHRQWRVRELPMIADHKCGLIATTTAVHGSDESACRLSDTN